MRYIITPLYYASLHVLLFIVYTMPCLLLFDLIMSFEYNGHKAEYFHTKLQNLLETKIHKL
jgi:hypothetical protein